MKASLAIGQTSNVNIASLKHTRLPGNLGIRYTSTKDEVAYLYKEHFIDKVYFQHGVTINPGDTIIDVGANIGLFSMYCAAACGSTGRVVAAEPCPELHAACLENLSSHAQWCKAQGHQVAEALALNVGLGDGTRSSATFTIYDKASGWSTMYPDDQELSANMSAYLDTIIQQPEQRPELQPLEQLMLEAARGLSGVPGTRQMYQEALKLYVQKMMMSDVRKVPCELTSLQQLMEQHHIRHVDLLKIDVERAELDVLRGMEPGQWKNIDQVVLEVHGEGGRLEAVQQLLSSAGFTAIHISKDMHLEKTNLLNLYATRRR